MRLVSGDAPAPISQAFRSVADEPDLMTGEGYDKQDFEKEAARRVQARILAGTSWGRLAGTTGT